MILDSDDDAFEALFLQSLLDDRYHDRTSDIETWIARFPARAALIRRTWGALREGAPPSNEDCTQRRVGRFRVLGSLGSGGQGEVSLGVDDQTGERVAIKVLAGLRAASADSLRRFRREAETAARVVHPGICPLVATGFERGIPYLVMAYIDGKSLAQLLSSRRRPPREGTPSSGSHEGTQEQGSSDQESAAGLSGFASITDVLRVFASLARALHAAHEAGVIHRDVKPGNIMLTKTGHPVLLDFGLASASDDRQETLTQSGDVLGTPAYMSPEQLTLTAKEIDRRTDVYSLGVTLYECVTGRRPFEATTREGLHRRILNEEPADPRLLNEAVTEDLSTVIRKALEKDPEDRYATAEGMAEDLERVALRRPVVARRPGRLTHLAKWSRRNPSLAKALLALGLALIVGTAVSVFFAMEARARLRDWERLADGRVLEDLIREAREELWPAAEDRAPAIACWLARARALVGRLDSHRAALAALRERALPFDVAAQARNRELNLEAEGGDEDVALRAERLRTAVHDARRKIAPETPGDPEATERARRLRELEAELAALEQRLSLRRFFEFADERDQLRHDKLRDLVEGLERLAEEGGADQVTIGRLSARWEAARTLRERTVEAHAARWRAVAERMGKSSAYRSLTFAPQVGLIPLGADPVSGLEEFAETATGSLPTRGRDGVLKITSETALVFVLLPGGIVSLGAQPDDPDAAHYDRLAYPSERPVWQAELAPFLMSKYEMTQGQWLRFAGNNPSFWVSPRDPRGLVPTLRSPVESVSWQVCHDVLRRLDLSLPTEAQWEYACRAGTSTAYATGDDARSLLGFANIADEGSAPFYPQGWNYERNFDDGHGAHSPVGSLRANGFGLHDLHGNVWEWCEDVYSVEPGRVARAGDGLRDAPLSRARVARGGSFQQPGIMARCGLRSGSDRGEVGTDRGCRPVRRWEASK